MAAVPAAFAAALQEWQAHRAQGAAALAVLQGLLADILAPPELPGSAKFWQRIRAQADSEALGRYIAAKGRQDQKVGPTVPEQIDQALQRLHTSMRSCEILLKRLQAAAADVEQAALSSIMHIDCDAARPTAALQEVALLVANITDSIEREHVMMRLVDGEVGLETPPQELETYATLWRLVPHLDDEAVALVQRMAQPG